MKRLVGLFLLYVAASSFCFAEEDAVLNQLKNTYDRVYPKDEYYEVLQGRDWTICDKQGKVLVPIGQFEWHWVIANTDCQFIMVKDKSHKWGIYDTKKAKLIIPVQYDKIDFGDPSLFYNYKEECHGFARIRKDDLYGMANIFSGRIIITPRYKDLSFGEDIFNKEWIKEGWVLCDGKFMHINSAKLYDNYEKLQSIFAVQLKDKWGMIDSLGTQILPIIYEDKPFLASNDLFCLKKNGKYGYVDSKTFKTIVDFKYEKAGKFNNDVAQVMLNGKWDMLPDPRKAFAQTNKKPKGKKKAVSSFPAPNSDVDTNIPENKQKAENTFAYIIANENYDIAKVPFALNDGWIFEQYCRMTLGIPEKNIHLYEDATAGNIIACVENLKETARAYEGEANIIFYYAGHAFPDEEDLSAYLLPVDGNSQNIATAYSLKKLYKEFNSVPIKQLVCFIDACFSGTTRTDDMLIEGRGVAVNVKDDVPRGNAVVFTSATGAETAHSYTEKGHGMYTYYLLQKLQETKGDVTLGELTTYVRKMVRRKSVVVNEKMQTPTVIPSASLGSDWQNWKLK